MFYFQKNNESYGLVVVLLVDGTVDVEIDGVVVAGRDEGGTIGKEEVAGVVVVETTGIVEGSAGAVVVVGGDDSSLWNIIPLLLPIVYGSSGTVTVPWNPITSLAFGSLVLTAIPFLGSIQGHRGFGERPLA